MSIKLSDKGILKHKYAAFQTSAYIMRVISVYRKGQLSAGSRYNHVRVCCCLKILNTLPLMALLNVRTTTQLLMQNG